MTRHTDPVWGELGPMMANAKAPDITVAEGRARYASQLLEAAYRELEPLAQRGGKQARGDVVELRRRIHRFLSSAKAMP